jgi:hypothetical protein
MNRATFRYRSYRDPRTELRMRIREIAQARVRYGYRKIRVLLNREGWKVGKYLVERIYLMKTDLFTSDESLAAMRTNKLTMSPSN